MSVDAPADVPCMSARFVCDYTGLSYRILDYWCRCALPDEPGIGADFVRGSGAKRLFTRHQAWKMSVLACARQWFERVAGGSIEHGMLRLLWEELDKHRSDPGALIVVDGAIRWQIDLSTFPPPPALPSYWR